MSPLLLRVTPLSSWKPFTDSSRRTSSTTPWPILALCRERWQGLKRTTRRDVVQHCDRFNEKDRRALRYLRSLEDKGLLESKADTTENGTEITFKPTE